MEKSYLPQLKIDINALIYNFNSIITQAKVEADQVIAVVKDSGYGLGSYVVAQAFIEAGAKSLGVARFDEALFLREMGITADILVFGPTTKEDLAIAYAHSITLTILSKTQLASIAKVKNNIPFLHLFVDTAMARNGITLPDLSLVSTLADLRRLKTRITGIYTHFHSADAIDTSSVSSQRAIFSQAQKKVEKEGVQFQTVHTSNSAASLYIPVPKGQHIRPGIALYGCRPDPNRITPNYLRDVIEISCLVSSTRKIKKGEGCSYGQVWKATKNTTIATIPIGYGDGYLRALSNRGVVLINGEMFAVVGRVTMDHIMVEIGDAAVIQGDRAIIIGRSGSLRITTDELALKAETIGYELLCSFGAHLTKTYVKNGKVVSSQERYIA